MEYFKNRNSILPPRERTQKHGFTNICDELRTLSCSPGACQARAERGCGSAVSTLAAQAPAHTHPAEGLGPRTLPCPSWTLRMLRSGNPWPQAISGADKLLQGEARGEAAGLEAGSPRGEEQLLGWALARGSVGRSAGGRGKPGAGPSAPCEVEEATGLLQLRFSLLGAMTFPSTGSHPPERAPQLSGLQASSLAPTGQLPAASALDRARDAA